MTEPIRFTRDGKRWDLIIGHDPGPDALIPEQEFATPADLLAAGYVPKPPEPGEAAKGEGVTTREKECWDIIATLESERDEAKADAERGWNEVHALGVELGTKASRIAELEAALAKAEGERVRLDQWRTEVLVHREVTKPPPGNELHAAVAIADAGYFSPPNPSQPQEPAETGERPWVPKPGEPVRRKYDGLVVKTLQYTPAGYVRYEKPDGQLGSDHIRTLEEAESAPAPPAAESQPGGFGPDRALRDELVKMLKGLEVFVRDSAWLLDRTAAPERTVDCCHGKRGPCLSPGMPGHEPDRRTGKVQR